MNILILGGNGQVGTELRRTAWPVGVKLHAPTRSELDVVDEAAIANVMASRPWSCVINASAYTAVDAAEKQVADSWRINALSPALLASASAKAAIPLIHISTDYVFDGRSRRAYRPDDQVKPLSVYGASKEGGEQAVRTANPRHVILRTAWVVSPHRANFVKTMLRLAGEHDVLRVVDDQTGCPTSAADLASGLRTIALRLAEDPESSRGTYHFVNSGRTTWCKFAREIMAGARRRGGRSVRVEAITTAEFKTAAHRPANSTLSTETLTRDFGIVPRPWKKALGDILDSLLAPTSSDIEERK